MTENLPYLTSDIPGTEGQIRSRASDFIVEEVPAYEPCGEGEHLFFQIEKENLTTFDAISAIAKATGRPTHEFGYAGMKDAKGVTRQVLSITGILAEPLLALRFKGVRILWAKRHGNKLRLGHLKGNRFRIRLRQTGPGATANAKLVVERLAKEGMPNYFGQQRFGARANNHLMGLGVIRGDWDEVLKYLLGDPHDSDQQDVRRARTMFDKGKIDDAYSAWPRAFGLERRVLWALKKGGSAQRAAHCVDQRIRRLWVTAAQSHIFNDILAGRLGTMGKLLQGDWAMKHENGACFLVTDPAVEQPRCDAMEISPTGPILGYRTSLAEGEAAEIEGKVLEASGLSKQVFKELGDMKAKGDRRALRVPVKDATITTNRDDLGEHLELVFSLPAGSFATSLLREIMKCEMD